MWPRLRFDGAAEADEPLNEEAPPDAAGTIAAVAAACETDREEERVR